MAKVFLALKMRYCTGTRRTRHRFLLDQSRRQISDFRGRSSTDRALHLAVSANEIPRRHPRRLWVMHRRRLRLCGRVSLGKSYSTTFLLVSRGLLVFRSVLLAAFARIIRLFKFSYPADAT